MSLYTLQDTDHNGDDGIHRPKRVEVRQVTDDAERTVAVVEENGDVTVTVSPGIQVAGTQCACGPYTAADLRAREKLITVPTQPQPQQRR